jgi:hypothetical protein
MAEVRIHKPERQLTIRLVSAADETSSWETMRSDLQSAGVKASLVRRNPVTPGDTGKLVIDLVHRVGGHWKKRPIERTAASNFFFMYAPRDFCSQL